MFVGHYSASLVAKRLVPHAPLWALFVAAQWIDVLWAGFIVAGVERGRIVPGFTAVNPLDLYFMPYSHGLPAALAWSALIGVIGFGLARRAYGPVPARRIGIALGLVAASHWLLDALVHRPDLALWDEHVKVGLGLWNHRWAALFAELGLLVGAALWLRSDPAVWSASGGRGLGILVAALVAFHLVNLAGPLPPSMLVVGASGLLIYVGLGLAALWVERRARR